MIDKKAFELIKEKHGRHASWAVWADEGNRPTENVGDLSLFDLRKNPRLLNQLNPKFVLVGLNISRPLQFPFGNFHDGRKQSKDYKLRYALKSTALWGAYMTDVIKDFEQTVAGEVMAYLRRNKSFEKANLESFEAELRDLRATNATIIALGGDAFALLTRNLNARYPVFKVPHYSAYGSKEAYRANVVNILKSKGLHS
jgi:hypothetical protein